MTQDCFRAFLGLLRRREQILPGRVSPHAMMAMAGLIQVSDSSNKSEIETAIQKFESAVMIPGVKTRISDLLRKNVK